MVSYLEENASAVANDVCRSIGRPLHQADEIPRLRIVAEQLIEDAKATFKTFSYPDDDGIIRFTTRKGKGVVLSVCAWNYPVAMPANLVIAPLLAGNTLIFKHAPQTAFIGDWFAKAGKAAGLPAGVFQVVIASHPNIERMISEGHVDVLEFIGSTRGGFALRNAGCCQTKEPKHQYLVDGYFYEVTKERHSVRAASRFSLNVLRFESDLCELNKL